MIQLPMRYKKSLTNFTHSTNRSQRSLSRAPSLDIFALKTRSLTYRIFRTRSKMQILVLKQRLSALGYTHDVNTCSDAEGLASVACTHTFLLTSPTDTCVSQFHVHTMVERRKVQCGALVCQEIRQYSKSKAQGAEKRTASSCWRSVCLARFD